MPAIGPAPVYPVANKAAVEVPAEPPPSLAVFKLLTSVQFVPFQTSVTAVALLGGMFPPYAKAAVFVPAPPGRYLAVFKLFTSVQLVPFHVSVSAT